MNSKTGGTILVGCKLAQDRKGNFQSKIKGAGTRYKSEANRKIFEDIMKEIEGNVLPPS